jgi:hypothetical protein
VKRIADPAPTITNPTPDPAPAPDTNAGSGTGPTAIGPISADDGPISANESFDDAPSYISIVDTTNTYQLFGADDGNLYLESAAAQDVGYFVLYDSLSVSTDDSGRLMYYYGDVMDKYGVSRMRMAYDDGIPVAAELATLALFNTDAANAETQVFVVVDFEGNYYYPVVATIDDGTGAGGAYSKVFLVKDIEGGCAVLAQEKLRWTVTGGEVVDCFYLPLMVQPDSGQPAPATVTAP